MDFREREELLEHFTQYHAWVEIKMVSIAEP